MPSNRSLILCALLVLLLPANRVPAQAASAGSGPRIAVGWQDTMRHPARWKPLAGINRPDVFTAESGAMALRMPHVPDGYPYSYQWGGVEREVDVDLARYPILVAWVRDIGRNSYAHMEVETRDFQGRPVRSLRSSTLQEPGLTWCDIGGPWGGDTLRMRLRLIVGGSLTGASSQYAWVRFVRREDLPLLQRRPNAVRAVVRP